MKSSSEQDFSDFKLRFGFLLLGESVDISVGILNA
jgi:hypothetical protein